jgi:hypothetical protein
MLLEEICTMGKLDLSYHSTLEKIISRIEKDGCSVMTRYDIKSSSYEPYADREPIARVSLKEVEDPLYIIWRLLHEYGHYLSGKRKPEDRTMDREELAWKYADELVRQYPDLHLRIDNFEKCKGQDLESYRRALGIVK